MTLAFGRGRPAAGDRVVVQQQGQEGQGKEAGGVMVDRGKDAEAGKMSRA